MGVVEGDLLKVNEGDWKRFNSLERQTMSSAMGLAGIPMMEYGMMGICLSNLRIWPGL